MAEYIVCDLEGTLSDSRHRRDLLPHNFADSLNLLEESWDIWNEAFVNDLPNKAIVDLISPFIGRNKVIIFTAKPCKHEKIVLEWFAKHCQINPAQILMRADGDIRSSVEVKADMVDIVGAENIILAIDDREDCCTMFEQWGIPTLKVTI